MAGKWQPGVWTALYLVPLQKGKSSAWPLHSSFHMGRRISRCVDLLHQTGVFPHVVLGTMRESRWRIWHLSLENSQVALIIWVWTFFGHSCSGVTFWEHLEIPVMITQLCLFWVIPSSETVLYALLPDFWRGDVVIIITNLDISLCLLSIHTWSMV